MDAFESRQGMQAAARKLHVHVATVCRWTLHGVRGQRLRTVRIGGRRFVLTRDLDAFLAALNQEQNLPPDDRRRRADVAGEKLDALGVTGVQHRD